MSNPKFVPQENALVRMRKKKTASWANFRPKNRRFNRNAYQIPPQIGRRYEVDVFVPDGGRRDASTVFGLSWFLIEHARSKQQLAAHFVSAVGAYIPDLSQVMVRCLNDKCIDVVTVDTPSQAQRIGYNIVEGLADKYSHAEIMLSLGISLLLIFKNIHVKNYEGFINAQKKALGGKLGMLSAEVARYRYPLTLNQAEMLKSSFTGDVEVQREILNWVMSASEDVGDMQSMASYVGTLLSWNEMKLLVFISNVFVHSGSPISRLPLLQHELETFKKCMIHIQRSPTPSYYRYFAPADVSQMLQRQNFRTLGAVARELIRRRSKNRSIDNFVGTTEVGSAAVKELADVHEEFCRTQVTGKNSRTDFFFGDYDYDEIVDAEEAARGEADWI